MVTSHFFPYHFSPLLGSVPTEKPFSLKKYGNCKIDSIYLQILDTITLREIRHL